MANITITPNSFIAAKMEMIKRYLLMNKATVFVGAGFSLNAEIPEHVTMKTWQQLRTDFLEKLYPDSKTDREKDQNDVVRLASLIDAQFKHAELDRILEQALPDTLIQPGDLHRKLVKLPWRDILTTNYDTLLERASQEAVCSYKLVTNKETLLYEPAPRIIKLHGSFTNVHPYVMTQEDYRRYPIDHPEMVNTVRQCFIESLVCMIGFSGEDFNFQAWLGWLRDVMGEDNLCPTYLVTYSENINDAEKALMRKRGIDYVNLYEIRGLNNYKSALDYFLSYIEPTETEWSGKISFDNLLK